MSATKLPDAALLGAVADLLAETHKANHASVRDLVAELARSRERIDEYGNVIETKFQALEIKAREFVASFVTSLNLKNGEPGTVSRGRWSRRRGGRSRRVGEHGEQGRKANAASRVLSVSAASKADRRGGCGGRSGRAGARGRRCQRGERGEQGPLGLQGEKGLQGEAGPMGPAAPLWRHRRAYDADRQRLSRGRRGGARWRLIGGAGR